MSWEKKKLHPLRYMDYLYRLIPARSGARQEGSSGNRFDRFQARIPSPNYCTALGQLLASPWPFPAMFRPLGESKRTTPPLLAAISRDNMYCEQTKTSSAQHVGARPRLQVEVELCAILLGCCRYATPRYEQAVSCGEAQDLIYLAPLNIKHEPLIRPQRDRGGKAGCACRRRSIQAFAMLTRRVGVVGSCNRSLSWFLLYCPVLPVISLTELLRRLLHRKMIMRTTRSIILIAPPSIYSPLYSYGPA